MTCYHLITLELPWQMSDTTGKAALHHDTFPPRDILELRPNLDRHLATTIMAGLKANPEERLPDMESFIRGIRGAKVSP
jgi:serine/threonine-protein kinase